MAADAKKSGGANPTNHNVKNNGKKGRNKGRQQRAGPTATKFDGHVPELKGCVYDFGAAKAEDLFSGTTKEIGGYVGRNYQMGGDMKIAVETLMLPTIAMPSDPPTGASLTEKKIWEEEVKLYVKKRTTLEENNKKLWSLLWGQCTESMQAKLEGMSSHEAIRSDGNGLELLKNIRTIVYQFQKQKHGSVALHMAKRRFYTFAQSASMSNHEYLEKFKNVVEVLESNGAEVGTDESLVDTLLVAIKLTRTSASIAQLDLIKKRAREGYLAAAFLLGADRSRYGLLIQDLENEYTQGVDKYPKDLVSSYHLLCNWKNNPSYLMKILNGVQDGLAFATHGETGRRDRNGKIKCYRCGKEGHIAPNCDELTNSKGEKLAQDDDEDNNDGAAMTQTQAQGETQNEQNEEGTVCLLAGSQEWDWFDGNAFAFTVVGHILSNSTHNIPEHWVLLDNQSTVDVFCNRKMLKNIRKAQTTMNIKCNAGLKTTNLIGDLPGYGWVWFMEDGIANILSLNRVKQKYRVTYDSTNGNTFHVVKSNGRARVFKQHPNGLYYMDIREQSDVNGFTMINTVEGNKAKYTERDYLRALKARKLQNSIGRPSTATFLEIIDKNRLRNNPFTRDDAVAAEDIFGPNLGSLKGKTTRQSPSMVRGDYTNVPLNVLECYRDITLCADIMFVNKIPFLVTISRNINFRTAAILQSRQMKVIMAKLLSVRSLYIKRGFRVNVIHADHEFEPMRAALMDNGNNIHLNVTAHDEHVPEIERSNRLVKERTRAIWNTMPFRKIPMVMLVELVYSVIFWLNNFPPNQGVGGSISPRTLITGLGVDFNKHCQLEFGEYVQTHEQHDNSLTTRTIGAIALRPIGNEQGGWYFLNLATGCRITRYSWTVLPMPKEVIDRVNWLGEQSHMTQDLLFQFSNGEVIENENDSDDETYNDESEHESDVEMDSATFEPDDTEFTGVGPVENENHESTENAGMQDPQEPSTGNNAENAGDPSDGGTGVLHLGATLDDTSATASDTSSSSNGYQTQPNTPGADNDTDDGNHDENSVDGNHSNSESDSKSDSESDSEERYMRKRYGHRSENEYNLRPRKKPRYILAQKEVIINNIASRNQSTWAKFQPKSLSRAHTRRHKLTPPATGMVDEMVFTQYSVDKGLKIFGQDGADAVKSEVKQLVEMSVMSPAKKGLLTYKELGDALPYLMFLKQKRCGKIKGRGCADGRRQRVYKTKEETSSPTVKTESVFITATIEAMENRHVVTVDVPGAFMQTLVDEKIHVRFEGPMVKLLCQVASQYQDYVVYERGKPVVYAKLNRALYGTLQAAYLFWKDLTSELEKMDFVVNPYDWCVANKTVNGVQCTVTWHVDDLKISCEDKGPINDVVATLQKRYGSFKPLTVNDSKVHDYLGMTLDYSEKGKVAVSMIQYIDELLQECPEDMTGTAVTPAGNNLFQIHDVSEKLDVAIKDLLHHIIAKLLYLSKRARPDIQTAVAFLTTRVRELDVDDYKKVARCVRYLRGTRDLKLRLEGSSGLSVLQWHVDGSFAVHPDMRSHTGMTMSLGKGCPIAQSTKQKLNTRSSTEAEIIAVDDAMGMIMWVKHFLNSQGYAPKVKLHQDNMSAMLLEKNGKASSGKRTRHLDIRYFFITDRIHRGEISVVYCPTDDMIADVMTKPLQGSKFRKFRQVLLNLDENTDV